MPLPTCIGHLPFPHIQEPLTGRTISAKAIEHHWESDTGWCAVHASYPSASRFVIALPCKVLSAAFVSGYEKITHFAQFIDFELVTPCLSRVVELFIALYFTSIAASFPRYACQKYEIMLDAWPGKLV